ncbi:putative solute-binding protein [Alkalimarinus coralli]|uniref:putative solute-binding protein n=1 Tax=Alkalimarinus coralli TaxID=2935863 RepID=UPI00202B097D|nr:putative solute-binding protein [Alkalimarinus coralli]
MKITKNRLKSMVPVKSALALAASAMISSAPVQAEMIKRSFCVWDAVGANGPLYNLMKSSKPAALKWGVDLELRPYTDEKIAAEDFKAGQCDSVLITDVRVREFNTFSGSIGALGAIQSKKEMRMILETLSQPKAAKLLKNGKYEIAGILPAGAVYLFARDRTIDTVGELQGKKIATFDYDSAAMHMVRHVGASIVGSSTANFAGKFNNGSVDIAYAPAVAYEPLELHKGIGETGGVFSYKVAQLTFQVVIDSEKFPEGFGQNFRSYAASKYDEAFQMIADAEATINNDLWVSPKATEVASYGEMFRNVRIGLRDEGVYSPKMLTLMRKVRCSQAPSNAECVEKTE